MPIAVPALADNKDDGSEIHQFEAPMVDGPDGEEVPTLLGLKSISGLSGVMSKSKRRCSSEAAAIDVWPAVQFNRAPAPVPLFVSSTHPPL